MRTAQIGIFILGLVSFLAASFFTGEDTGETLWKTGMAAMLVDIVFMKLWPSMKS